MNWNKIITRELEYEKALKRLSKIFDARPDSAEGMEAELLVTLIDKFEKENYPIDLPEPITAIKEAMQMKGLKDKDLIAAIGSKTTVSLVLNRKRALILAMIRNLSKLLGLPVDVLIQSYRLDGKKEMVD